MLITALLVLGSSGNWSPDLRSPGTLNEAIRFLEMCPSLDAVNPELAQRTGTIERTRTPQSDTYC